MANQQPDTRAQRIVYVCSDASLDASDESLFDRLEFGRDSGGGGRRVRRSGGVAEEAPDEEEERLRHEVVAGWLVVWFRQGGFEVAEGALDLMAPFVRVEESEDVGADFWSYTRTIWVEMDL